MDPEPNKNALRLAYRRRIHRHIAVCVIVVALCIGLVAGLANVEALREIRPIVISVLVGLILLLVIATFVNLRCPKCSRFLDSRFLMSSRPDCPRCNSVLRN